MKRVKMTIRGAVQGVGFRPFAYCLARELHLTGFVANTARGVVIQVQGAEAAADAFAKRVLADAPPVSFITGHDLKSLPPVADEAGFVIRFSDDTQAKTVAILPDLNTCPDCLTDIRTSGNRRYRYAFTNCTHCGPRFSIINDLPYDRAGTEMRAFAMCPQCEREYHDPLDRRFHAQPNACPDCGPALTLMNANVSASEDPLQEVAAVIRSGGIVALKGIGGYQLLCDARNEAVVKELRKRKGREEKPFALMVPNLDLVRRCCHLSQEELGLLQSSAAPIVLLRRRENAPVAPSVAPGNPNLGVMLPYAPLHHLLMETLEFPVVCTSGNLHDEPIAIANEEARTKLAPIADVILAHNRSIARHLDDSVVRHTLHGAQYFRRARGYAPFPVIHRRALPPILAVGAHYKNTIAIAVDRQTILSQHIGDLSTPEAHRAFHRVVEDLPRLYGFKPGLVACDLHPDYLSSRYAHGLGLPVVPVQHHHAHIAAVMAEHDEDGPVLGFSWDGAGLGADQTVWGGEVLLCEKGNFERVDHLFPFPLPGGDAAAKEPRRSALGLLQAAGLDARFPHGFTEQDLALVNQALDQGVNSPLTSSMGRLFDGVAALLGLRQITAFEGQSAMALEFAACGSIGKPYPIDKDTPLDWRPVLQAILKDRERGISTAEIAARFHGALIEALVTVARRAGVKKVALSGGCFQNRLLHEGGVGRLAEAGFAVLLPKRLPPNDGGIAAGQIWVAAYGSR